VAEGRRSEWAANWPLLLAAIVGIPVPVVMSAVLGQFMAPLEQEFGWTRAEASVGYSISLLLGFLAGPLIGQLVDKTNARLLVLPGIVLTALAISAFSLATPSIAVWIALWCAVSLVGSLVGPTVWITVVSAAFEQKRSLAIAITLSGMSLATMLGPLSARLVIDAWGWRTAWIILGVVWTTPALILTLLFFFDRRPAARPKAEQPKEPATKVPLRRVFLSFTFIRLALAIVIVGLVGSAFAIHMAPALMDKGMNATTAAAVAGILGLAGIAGRITLGSIFDRAGQDIVVCCIMTLYALAAAVLAQNSINVALAVAGCVMLGLASGAKEALVACLITRLFDARIFGTIYGSLISLAVLAAAMGPLLAGRVHDIAGTYAPAFWSGVGIALFAVLLLVRLTPVSFDEPAPVPAE
jgi:MFS family permease